MALALSLGNRGRGRTWPNPSVGCVLVQDGRIVGRGWTQPGGRPHAERHALDQAGPLAVGATAYVSLEPCSHHGKTPPCAQGLIDAGIARVVVATRDPDPRVAGRGIKMLRDAGIPVNEDILKDQADETHAGFFQRLSTGRPYLTLKLANSVDGRIATATGESQWITGAEARRAVHADRARHDAVLVGAGTARADDPSLTARGLGMGHQPVRIVASRMLDIPLTGKLATTATQIPLWLVHGAEAPNDLVDAWRGLGAQLTSAATQGRQLDAQAVMQALGAAGLTRVYCEGGGQLAASLLQAGVVNELVTYSAGIALGAEGQPALAAMGVDRLAGAPRFDLFRLRQIGGDVEARWRVRSP